VYKVLGILMIGICCQVLARPVVVKTKTQEVVFDVREATTAPQRAKGLQHVKSLPEKGGMLFLFEKPTIPVFWMKDTFIPLDMIFFTQGGEIVQIEPDCVPFSEENIPAKVPVIGVLEIGGGLAEKYHIRLGDTLTF